MHTYCQSIIYIKGKVYSLFIQFGNLTKKNLTQNKLWLHRDQASCFPLLPVFMLS